jgi:selenocysteine lyase/cysteine desulfurase
VSFRDLGCDYFVTSLHKGLGAPVGNGMLVMSEAVIDRTWPLLAPFGPPPLRIDKFDQPRHLQLRLAGRDRARGPVP